jgi:DNA-binding transcriptional ArsR family regulator
VATYESVLDALGDRTRRQIVQVLRGGPVSVGELSERLPVSRPAISQHLKVLQACQLVAYEPVGTRHLYRLDPAGARELRAWLDDFWDGALGRFARYAADQAAGEPASAGDSQAGGGA